MKKLALVLCCSSLAIAQTPPTTSVQDTLSAAATGATNTGTLTISWSAFNYGGYTVAPSPQRGSVYQVVNGVINPSGPGIALVPTDHATGCPSNCPTYRVLATFGSNVAVWYWSVPTLPSGICPSGTCSVQDVLVNQAANPAIGNINVSQIGVGSSTNGQGICNVDGFAVWSNCGGGGNAVWGAITGTLADQSDLQSALNAKQPLGATNNVTCASSVSFDATKGPVQAITLTCDVTSVSIVNLWAGATLKFHICEGSSGGYAWPAWPGVFHGAFTPGEAANKCSDQVFQSPDGTNLYAQSIGVINQ